MGKQLVRMNKKMPLFVKYTSVEEKNANTCIITPVNTPQYEVFSIQLRLSYRRGLHLNKSRKQNNVQTTSKT